MAHCQAGAERTATKAPKRGPRRGPNNSHLEREYFSACPTSFHSWTGRLTGFARTLFQEVRAPDRHQLALSGAFHVRPKPALLQILHSFSRACQAPALITEDANERPPIGRTQRRARQCVAKSRCPSLEAALHPIASLQKWQKTFRKTDRQRAVDIAREGRRGALMQVADFGSDCDARTILAGSPLRT